MLQKICMFYWTIWQVLDREKRYCKNRRCERIMTYEVGELLATVKSFNKHFTKSERKIASTFLSDPERIIYSSITDFAERSGVGDATVVRFCRKLGFKGYHDFKIAVARELSETSPYLPSFFNGEVASRDDIVTIMHKLLEINLLAMEETIVLSKEEDVTKAVSFIEESDKTIFYGVGSSGITALEAKNKFMRIGVPVDAYVDGHMQAMSASFLKEAHTAVAISYSGSTKDIIHTLQTAKKGGAKTICITHYAKSPITQYADIILLTGAKQGPLQGSSLSTKVAQLFMVDILYTEYFRRNLEESSIKKALSTEAVLGKLY